MKKTLKLVIQGRPCSKKNSRRNFGHISLPSKAYERFHEDALWQLKKVKEKFTGPISVQYFFMHKGKMRQDCSNAMASIEDTLQDAGIIDDDDNIMEGSFEKAYGNDIWWTEVIIKQL